MSLANIVKENIKKLGVKEASKFYSVSAGTISNWSTGTTSPSIRALELTAPGLAERLAPTQLAAAEPKPSPEVEPLEMWEGRKVAILQPVYRTFNPETHFTLFANYVKYGPEKIALLPPRKRTLIHESRNYLVDRAMKTTSAERFIMVDDDMILPFGDGNYFNSAYNARVPAKSASLNTISRLVSSGVDRGIVGALYFGRSHKGRAQCSIGFTSPSENQALRAHERSGLVPTHWVGTGVIKIERWVVERMKAEIDNGRWPECKPSSPDEPYGYFTPTKVGVGEDVSFGVRAAEIGIQSYVDADLECLHAGEEYYGSANTNG